MGHTARPARPTAGGSPEALLGPRTGSCCLRTAAHAMLSPLGWTQQSGPWPAPALARVSRHLAAALQALVNSNAAFLFHGITWQCEGQVVTCAQLTCFREPQVHTEPSPL